MEALMCSACLTSTKMLDLGWCGLFFNLSWLMGYFPVLFLAHICNYCLWICRQTPSKIHSIIRIPIPPQLFLSMLTSNTCHCETITNFHCVELQLNLFFSQRHLSHRISCYCHSKFLLIIVQKSLEITMMLHLGIRQEYNPIQQRGKAWHHSPKLNPHVFAWYTCHDKIHKSPHSYWVVALSIK